MNCPHGANNTANMHWASDNCLSAASDFNTVSCFWLTFLGYQHWKWKQLLFCARQQMHSSCHFGQHSGATEKHLVNCWRCGWEHLLCLRSSEYWQLWCPVSFLSLCRRAVCPSTQRSYSVSWLLEITWKRWTHQHQGRIKYYDSFLLRTLMLVFKADQKTNNLFGTRGTLLDCLQ